MTPFRDLPIRHKLLVMTLASSAAAIALTVGGFLIWETIQFRADVRQDVDAYMRILAENSAAPLAFEDERAAGETLAVLELRPRVTMACAYNVDRRLVATYHRDIGRCPGQPPAGLRFGWTAVEATLPVLLEGKQVGTLYAHRDLSDLYARLRVGGVAAVGLLMLAAGTAFLIGARMQRAIVAPLLGLAGTARTISARRDYALRAAPGSRDEVGDVTQAVNDMLDRLAERDAELLRTNEELQREVEERKRVERQRTEALERERDANRLKDEFLATVSHELRTPLNAVLGWARVLRTAQVEPRARERALESIERNALAQARLIEDLLEISRIVTGKLRLQVQTVDLAAIVGAAVEVVQPAAAAKRIRLTTRIEARPAMTSGDADRLQQVIWNLLSNAVKFTPADGRVDVSLTQNGGYRIRVTDTGLGMEPRFLPYLFEPFRQADGTPSREHGGLGLGLAIARQLVELHGGTIAAQSAGLGAGSTFEVYLPSTMPVAAESGRPAPAATAPVPPDGSVLAGLRVLVVDDEEDQRALLTATLEQYGATVLVASSAAEALARLERLRPDVLLSDIGMPHEDGYDLIRRVRARAAAEGGAVPAVALTAYASERDRDAALEAGFQAHIAKPFDPRDLVDVVARLGKR